MWKGRIDPPGSLCSYKEYTVKIGDIHLKHASTRAFEVPVRDIVIHQDYSTSGTVENDIALAMLEVPVNYSPYVQPVCIPESDFMVQTGTECWVTGWGKLNEKGETVKQIQAREKAVWCPGVGLQAEGRHREAIFLASG